MTNFCKRTEVLADYSRGREYYINVNDERIIEKYEEVDENTLDNAIDGFEEAYNFLEVIDGKLYEVMEVGCLLKIMRRAYLLPDDTPAKGFKELRELSGMNLTQFSAYFGLVYRTCQHWEAGSRECPEYLLRLMEYKLVSEELI